MIIRWRGWFICFIKWITISGRWGENWKDATWSSTSCLKTIRQERKAHAEIKKVQKEKGIKFQTPLTKIKIHWSDGPKIYNSAREAMREMEKRGIDVRMRDEEENSAENRLQGTLLWQKVRGPSWSKSADWPVDCHLLIPYCCIGNLLNILPFPLA